MPCCEIRGFQNDLMCLRWYWLPSFIVSVYTIFMPTVPRTQHVPRRYVPTALTQRDAQVTKAELRKSRKLYRQGRYYTRRQVKSFPSRKSSHLAKAQQLYGVDHVIPGPALARATGCSVAALKKIVNKGQGAYYSSGSRPNQTAQSWGLARLASAVSGGKASAVDFTILRDGCSKTSKALRLAQRPASGRRRVPQVSL